MLPLQLGLNRHYNLNVEKASNDLWFDKNINQFNHQKLLQNYSSQKIQKVPFKKPSYQLTMAANIILHHEILH